MAFLKTFSWEKPNIDSFVSLKRVTVYKIVTRVEVTINMIVDEKGLLQ